MAVQASRISTHFHQVAKLGDTCQGDLHESHARTARFLLMLVVPGHLALNVLIGYLQGKGRKRAPSPGPIGSRCHAERSLFFADSNPFSPSELPFLGCYLAACLVQVWILLKAAGILVRTLW